MGGVTMRLRGLGMRGGVTALILALAVLTVGAVPAGAQRAGMSVRDSAGVRIVSHARAAQPAGTWRIGQRPLLEIGGGAAAGPTLFDDILGAARTPRGEIIVSDGATQQLRMFDATGKHLRSFGRRGSGPGEFSQIRRVYVRGDSVIAADVYRGSAVFRLDGTLVRHHAHPVLGAYLAIGAWGVLADGSVIETASGGPSPDRSRSVGTFTETHGLFRISADGRSATLLRDVPMYDYARTTDSPDKDLVVFAPTLSVAASGNRVCFGRGETYQIQCVSGAGAPVMTIRRDVALTPVTAQARAAYQQRVRTQGPTPGHDAMPQARLDAIAANAVFGRTFPAFDRILAGVNGELWVSDYRYENRTRPRDEQAPPGDVTRWNVFARDGTWSAAITLPTRFSVKQIGADFLLGVSRDDDGVERVTLYRLERGR